MFGKKKQPASTQQPARRRFQDSATTSDRVTQTLNERHAFRRNRTITGSSSAKVASSAELNADLQSPRAHVHHLTNVRRKLFMGLMAVVVVSFLLYVLASQLVAALSLRVVAEDVMTAADERGYTAAIDEYYAAKPIERLRFLLNRESFTSHMQAAHPEIETITVDPGESLGEASVVISAREPVARWTIDGTNRYVDSTGVVFERSYFGIPQLQIVDNSGITSDTVKAVASNRFLGFVGRLIALSEDRGLIVQKITIPTLTTRQVAVNIKGKPYQFKFSIDRSAGKQVEDMARITDYMTKQRLQPEYVDIRVEGKAFYK
jgi:hypothetical protein